MQPIEDLIGKGKSQKFTMDKVEPGQSQLVLL